MSTNLPNPDEDPLTKLGIRQSLKWLERNVGSNWGRMELVDPNSPGRIMSSELGSPLRMTSPVLKDNKWFNDEESADEDQSVADISSRTELEDSGEDTFEAEGRNSLVELHRRSSIVARASLLGVNFKLQLPARNVQEQPSPLSSRRSMEEFSSPSSRESQGHGRGASLEFLRLGIHAKSSTIHRGTFEGSGATLLHPLIVRSGSHQQSRPDWQAWLAPGGGEKALSHVFPRVSIRLATEGDLPELLWLGMPSNLGEPPSPEAALRQWLASHPQGQFVVASATGELLGAMYTRRIASYADLLCTLTEESGLHITSGPVLQLLGVFQRPGASVGSLLLRHLMAAGLLDNTVAFVCCISNCHTSSPQEGTGRTTCIVEVPDEMLAFHSLAGAYLGMPAGDQEPRTRLLLCHQLRASKLTPKGSSPGRSSQAWGGKQNMALGRRVG